MSPRDKLFRLKVKSNESDVSPIQIFNQKFEDDDSGPLHMNTAEFNI